MHREVGRSGRARVAGFRQGIEAAIPALRRYARALTRKRGARDDLVQDTLVRALRSEHLFHGGDIAPGSTHPDQSQPQPAALAGATPTVQPMRTTTRRRIGHGGRRARTSSATLAALVEDQRACAAAGRAGGALLPRGRRGAGRADRHRDVAARARRMQIKAYLDGERPVLRRIK